MNRGWLVSGRDAVRYFAGWRPHAQRHFSQEGEDIVMARIFIGQSSGFYVDVGAHHPRRFSNTYWAYARGWRGIDIDASPGSRELFTRQRPRDIAVEMCVGEIEGTREFFVFPERALNTADPKRRDAMESATGAEGRRVSVRSARLSTILEQNLPHEVEQIDFMSIDVEGSEMAVLRSNDWDRYAPRAIVIEILGFTMEAALQSAAIEFLRPMGYVPVSMLYHSIILVRDTALLDAHWGARLGETSGA